MRTFLAICLVFLCVSDCVAQRGNRDKTVVDHPQAVGDPGIAWYTTWKTGLKEARRSNRPIFFMSAATCSRGVSGAF